jgi:hypothetical protein
MEYDIKTHLGQQIENFLNAYAGADAAAMERIKRTIIDIYKNTPDDGNLIISIRGYDKRKQDELDKIKNKALDAMKTITQAKNLDELFIDLEEIKNDTIRALNLLETDYWDSLRGLFLKNIKE